MRKKPGDPYQGTALVIANITDPAKFQTLCDRLLEAHYHFEVHPRGISEHGTVKGQPDSRGYDLSGREGYDLNGRVCAFQYGICTSTSWPGKLESDLKAVASIKDFSPEIFVFCTNCRIDPEKEREWETKVKSDYGWKLQIIGVLELANVLDVSQQGIRRDVLEIEVEHHNWESFLAACHEQRQRQYNRYSGKYDPSLYVQRQAEQRVQAWYRQMVASLYQGKPQAGRLAIVDQAGAGKTNIVFHLAEEFGSKAPVIIIPGNVIIADQHTLEREVVEAVGYPVNDRTYHADIHELCKLAHGKGFPFLVIIDGADENSEPTKLRIAIEYLWSVCQNYSFLLLVTCRDAFWSLIQSPLWKNLSDNPSQGRYIIPLGGYNDDELKQATTLYFSKYNIHVQLGYEAAQRLRSPLLLRIFAEIYQGSPYKLIRSIADSDLWKKYLAVKLDAIHEAVEEINIPERDIQEIIENIALLMAEENKTALTSKDLANVHPLLSPYEKPSRSLFLQLKNAGVLFEDSSGRVKFVYESFLEFIVGNVLSRTYENVQEREDTLLRIERLARDYRWQRVPLYVAENVEYPAAIIERLCITNLWLAANAVRQLQSLIPPDIQARVITSLEESLSSRFTLDRQRAARLLGVLGATRSKDALLQCWLSEKSEAALCSLARLGMEEVVEPFIHYLGKRPEWYLLENQELIDASPQGFRHRLAQTGLALLSDPERASDAAHTLGYLKYEQATDALFTYLVSTEYCDWAALGALLHMQTEASFERVEIALGELGKRLDLKDQQGVTGSFPANSDEDTPTRSELYWALDYIRVYGAQQCSREKIISFLTKLLSYQNEYVRYMAVKSLGHLGAAETVLAMIQSKQSETKNPTMGITETLYELGTQIDVGPIIALVDAPSVSENELHLFIRALGLSRDKRAIDVLKVFLRKPQFVVSVVIALGESTQPDAVPLLVQTLESKKVNFRGSGVKNREMLDYMIVESLGKLQNPSAFPELEKFAQQKLPVVWVETISALAATGGERAIPFLHQAWELDVKNRKYIIQALSWIGTKAAIDKIKELLAPYDIEKAILLAKAVSPGGSILLPMGESRSSMVYDWIDDQLVGMLDKYVDEINTEDKLTVIFALEHITTPAAQRLLERIASDPHYDIQRSSGSPQTLRDVAVWGLCEVGSEKATDLLLDKLADHNLGFLEFLLAKQEQERVRDALERSLSSANDVTLGKLLELLGFFGDHTVLPTIATYIDDPRTEIADAAYTAQQQILGMAY